jgi:Plavaka transposase
MKEQILLTNLVRGACPKCLDVCGHLEVFHHLDQCEPATSWIDDAVSRLDEEALSIRERFAEGTMILEQLKDKQCSYHPDHIFSGEYPFGGILDALRSDLLHQISKYFKNYMMKQ